MRTCALGNICRITMLILAVVQISTAFLGTDTSWIIFLLGVVLLTCSIPLMDKSFKIPTLIFLAAGLSILILDKQPFSVLVTGAGSMLTVASILIIMSLFTIPIQIGDYFNALEYILIKYLHNEVLLFLFVLIIAHIFGSFLLFGTIPVMMALFGEVLYRNVRDFERFFSAAVSRGYALIALWAPGSVNILLVIQGTGSQWSELFLPGLFLSIVGLVTAYLLEAKLTLSRREITFHPADGKGFLSVMRDGDALKKTADIMLVVLGLAGLTVFFEKIGIYPATTRAMLAGLTIVMIWIFKYLKSPELKNAFHEYWESGLLKSLDLAGLFVAMGIISEAVNQSSFIIHLQHFLLTYVNALGTWVIPLIPLLIILASLVGIHPFITIVMTGNMLTLIDLPISSIALAMAISLGGAVSYIVSPFAGLILTLAKFTQRTPVEISIKWNGVFTLIYLVEGVVFIYILQILSLN